MIIAIYPTIPATHEQLALSECMVSHYRYLIQKQPILRSFLRPYLRVHETIIRTKKINTFNYE